MGGSAAHDLEGIAEQDRAQPQPTVVRMGAHLPYPTRLETTGGIIVVVPSGG